MKTANVNSRLAGRLEAPASPGPRKRPAAGRGPAESLIVLVSAFVTALIVMLLLVQGLRQGLTEVAARLAG